MHRTQRLTWTLALLAVCTASRAAERPNILLIVSDDQGYNDLGILGNGIITPALDRLAKEGARLTNFYVAWPACTPSRAGLLTGRYPQRNGIYDMIRNEAPDYGHKYSPEEYDVTFERIGGMDLREIILPRMLKSASYKSGIYGKWDLGTLKRFLPTSRGFDDFYGMLKVLEDKEILDNTIVIFFSDNGGSGGADNTPLRGRKAQTWEGGIRVPCLIRWPGGDVPAGVVNDEFLTSLELFPSFASATGAKLPENVSLDGYDWWSTLRGESKSPRSEMFWTRKDLVGARVGNWKWVDMGGESGGLFDLDADIGEKNDLSVKRPDILKMVKDRYAN